MKLRLKAVLLALGLTISSLSLGVCAEETEVDAVEEAVEVESEADEAEDTSEDEAYKNVLENYLSQISEWSDETVESYMESETSTVALIAYNWNTVKAELGSFVEVTEITDYTMEITTSGYGGYITGIVAYENVGTGSTVTVTLEYEYTYSSSSGYSVSPTSIEWEVDYTFAVLMQKAALNTAMGIAIVFLSLLFLSFLIGKIHYIPEIIEERKKAKEPTPAPAPAAAPVAAPVVEVVEETDDLELIAVITAAIAAFEESAGGTGDAYVVRSIKKLNKRNWR